MTRAKILAMFFVGMILISLPVWGQNFTGDDDALAPYLSTKTLVIARLDVTRLDVDGLKAWEMQVLKSATNDANYQAEGEKDFSAMHNDMKKWQDGFLKSGGKRIYLIVDLNVAPAPILIVPVDANTKTEDLINVMKYGDVHGAAKDAKDDKDGPACELIDNKILLFTESDQLADVKKIPSAPRPELLKTLAGAGDVTVAAAIEPTGDLSQALVVMGGPDLPLMLGGGKTADILGAITRGSGALDGPPKLSLNIAIHCTNADGANSIKTLVDTFLKFANEEMLQDEQEKVNTVTLSDVLKPVVEGADVKISLDTDAVMKGLGGQMVVSFIRAREAAKSVQCVSNIHQILLGCLLYANDHKGDYPADLSVGVMGQYLGGEAAMKLLMTNPRNPEKQPGFEYVNPGANPPADAIVVYEAGADHEANIAVGYGDGHAEMVKKDEFAKQLAATKAAEQGK